MTREEAVKVMQLNIAECEDTLCYSENKGIREQKEAFEIALEALQPWVRTADRLPDEADANKESKVLGWIPGYGYRGADYKFVISRPEHVTWWMPFPSRLEVEG